MKRTIFQHIPKTAGSSIREVFIQNFKGNIFVLGSRFDIKNLLYLDQKSRDEIELLYGHANYGIHRSFSSDDSEYCAFLRDPVDRTISQYHYIKNNPDTHFHKYANQMDMVEFIRAGHTRLSDNCMVRMISGVKAIYGKCTITMLDQALENIDRHYCFVGLFEQLDEDMNRLSAMFGWGDVSVPHVNVTANRPTVDSLWDSEHGIIVDHNQLDIVLYEKVKERLHAIEANNGQSIRQPGPASIEAVGEQQTSIKAGDLGEGSGPGEAAPICKTTSLRDLWNKAIGNT